MATGHLRKRGDSWLITIEAGRDASGKRKRIYKSVKVPKKEAQRIMYEMIAEIERGTYVEPKKITVEEYLLYWLENKKPNLAPRTYESYEMIVKKHLIPVFGTVELAKLQPLAIEEYKNKKLASLSNRTVQYHLSVLSQAYNAAVKLQLVYRNPVEVIEKPRVPKKRAEFLTPEQVDVLLEAAKNKREYPAIYFALHTGMRLGEALGLLWENVDLKNRLVHVRKQLQVIRGKGIVLQDILKTDSSYRTISISKPVVELLMSLPRLSEYVFCIPEGRYAGKPYDPNNFANRFKEIAKEAELDITFHTLRHTHASLLLAAGEQLNVVQERLGHERASTTSDIYAHVLPNRQERSADLFAEILGDGRQNGDKNQMIRNPTQSLQGYLKPK